MRFVSAVALAAAVMTVAAASSPADAQGRRYYRNNSESITFIDENGRRRTKITVRPRSYLDGGTEVFAGERKFMGYAQPSTYLQASPSAAWDPTGSHRSPLPMPFELPGYSPYSYW